MVSRVVSHCFIDSRCGRGSSSVVQYLCCSGRLACLITVLVRAFCHPFSVSTCPWLADRFRVISRLVTAIVLVKIFC